MQQQAVVDGLTISTGRKMLCFSLAVAGAERIAPGIVVVPCVGGQGIGLRESHPLEGMIIDMLKDCKSEADVEKQLKALASRIVLSYGEATPEGSKFELA